MSDRAGESREGEPVGSFGEELGRFLTVAQDWVRQNFELPEHSEEHPTVCEWCPVCQFVAVLRGDRPEVSEKVAQAGTAVVAALQALTQAADEARGGETPGPDRPRVQRIDLDDDQV